MWCWFFVVLFGMYFMFMQSEKFAGRHRSEWLAGIFFFLFWGRVLNPADQPNAAATV